MRRYLYLTLLVAVVAPSFAHAADPAPALRQASRLNGGPRVRASDQRLVAAIAEGVARSPSFLSVINDIEQLDVIAYVEMQPQLRGRLSGAVTWVTRTAQFRYVRVALNPDLTGMQLVSALAHELQHVVEVGREASVIDADSLGAFYQTVGVSIQRFNPAQWETEAARRMGETVRRELAGATPPRTADSIQAGVRD